MTAEKEGFFGLSKARDIMRIRTGNPLLWYLVIGLSLLLVGFLYYTDRIVKKLEREGEELTLSLVELAAYLPSIDDMRLSQMASRIVRGMMRSGRLSFIITDKFTGRPIIAKGIDEELERKILNDEPLSEEERGRVKRFIEGMDRSHRKIPIEYVLEDRVIIGFMYYGDVSAESSEKLPFVFTDVNDNPLFWRIWGDFKTAEEAPEEIERARAFVRDAKEHRRAVTVQISPEPRQGYFHYKVRRHNELFLMPFLQTALITAFLGAGFWMYRRSKRIEQAAIWGGLAKETAHQLGTPISSLMGWVELLEEKVGDREDLREILSEMEGDLDRLRKVTARFGEIGSLPKKEPRKISDVVHEAVRYYRARIASRRRRIEIIERYKPDLPPVMVNDVLMSWVIENLIKNSLDAFDKERGIIEIETDYDPRRREVVIRYSDNGRGIPRRDQRRIFQPGFTTKKHGWGLGLALSKRIVEEYHGGRLSLLKSGPEGTTFEIRLPASHNAAG